MQLSLDIAPIPAHRDLIEDVRAFDQFGRKTATPTVQGIPYFVNEFWTSGQRQAHSLHEVSYRACFKAQLPQFFIDRLTGRGDLVYDPFMGRGTTPLQAVIQGRAAAGNDINPLSSLLCRPRTRPVRPEQVQRALMTVDWQAGQVKRPELLAFYHPATLARLEALRDWIEERAPITDPDPDPVVDWIRMVSINRLSGHSPGFFSGRSMPPNQAVSIKAQLRINEKLGLSPPERDVASVILKKTRTLLKDGVPAGRSSARFCVGPAWDTPELADGSVALTITSPPFLDIVDYEGDNWLRCWFAGIDPAQVRISKHRTEAEWTDMTRRVLAELARITKPGGHVAYEVGEVRNGRVLLERLVWQAAEGLPFERLGVMVNDQEFTKTANCWGVDNGTKGTNTNRIVLLRRL